MPSQSTSVGNIWNTHSGVGRGIIIRTLKVGAPYIRDYISISPVHLESCFATLEPIISSVLNLVNSNVESRLGRSHLWLRRWGETEGCRPASVSTFVTGIVPSRPVMAVTWDSISVMVFEKASEFLLWTHSGGGFHLCKSRPKLCRAMAALGRSLIVTCLNRLDFV